MEYASSMFSKAKTFVFVEGPQLASKAGKALAMYFAVVGAFHAADEYANSPARLFDPDDTGMMTVGVFVWATLAGLMDTAGAGLKAIEFGDWDYGQVLSESFATTGMSPEQMRVLKWMNNDP
jgi:hypothetical protein